MYYQHFKIDTMSCCNVKWTLREECHVTFKMLKLHVHPYIWDFTEYMWHVCEATGDNCTLWLSSTREEPYEGQPFQSLPL